MPAAIAGGLGLRAAAELGLVTALGPQRLFGLQEAWLVLVAMIVAALLAQGRARALPHALAGAVLVLYVLVAFTPLFSPSIRAWLEEEPPRRADAIVVLSARVTEEGRLGASALERLVAGAALARDGWAPLLVRTEASAFDDRRDAAELLEGTDVEVARIGPVASTRDEAVATAALGRERGFRRVIVVTSPLHERRAAAAFRDVGLEVVACPSPERLFSVPALATPDDRVAAFGYWVTELAAWELYSLRGWVR